MRYIVGPSLFAEGTGFTSVSQFVNHRTSQNSREGLFVMIQIHDCSLVLAHLALLTYPCDTVFTIHTL